MSKHFHGFVSVGRGQGSYMGWDLIVARETPKAILLRDAETGRTCWLPKSAIDGDTLSNWAVSKIRDARFKATGFYGDVV